MSQSGLEFPVRWIAVVGVTRVGYIYGVDDASPSDRRKPKLYFPSFSRFTTMRKTKLIILPTKCLNRLGFLLLFLSCPVIGDWGRIRPDTEMSQWSIQIEREGSCGLVRDSPGIKDSITPDGLMECYAADATIRNNTQSLTEIPETSQESKNEFISEPTLLIRESRVERRVSNTRQERSFRRSTPANIRLERRSVSLDRETPFRYDERRNDRMQREVRLERNSRERREYRRVTRSLDRRVDSRRMTLERRVRDEREHDTARRLSVARRERRVNERRDTVETARRRIENRIQSRSEEQRSTRRVLQDERSDARRDAERRVREDRSDAERRNSPERRRSSEERRTLELTARRSVDRTERRTRERDIRVRNTEPSRRISREESERRVAPESRRLDIDLARKQEMRVAIRRVEKPDDRRDLGVTARMNRERSARLDYRMKPLTLKNEGRWEFLNGLKTFFGQKSEQDDWVSNHGDFATTCFVGAAVYFLTTRHVKSV